MYTSRMAPPPTETSTPATEATARPRQTFESRVDTVGRGLSSAIGALLETRPEALAGPQAFADTFGLDKVLGSRVLKMLRASDPIATVHRAPGPAPLRRVVDAAAAGGAAATDVATATAAIDDLDHLIRHDAGDRGALDAILSAWLPEARREFELRRKQAAWRAMSQLRGASVDVNLGVAILAPSEVPGRIDIVWVMGLLGLERLRPGVAVRLSTKRLAPGEHGRHPMTLEGLPMDSPEAMARARIEGFGERPSAEATIVEAGEAAHYVLEGDDFGAASATDFLMGEVNRNEISATVPAGSGRRGFVFSSLAWPTRRLHMDVFVHEDVYPGAEPELIIHDTAVEGSANINDRSRDLDRLDLVEQIQSLGRGLRGVRTSALPRYPELLRHVFGRLGWDSAAFRGWRAEIDFPVHGSQTSMAFAAPEADTDA